MEVFYAHISTILPYNELVNFILSIPALPQSTAGVERVFSKVTANKTKLRNSTRTLEAILATSEGFKDDFEVN